MGRTLAALLIAATVLLSGCALPSARAVPDDSTAQEPAPDASEQTPDMEPDESVQVDEPHPANPSGTTEYGFILTGAPYEVGPVTFNCPTSFMVTRQTDEEIELYDLDGAMLRVSVEYGNYEFDRMKTLTEDQIAGVINGGAPDIESSEARWVGRYDDYVTYSAKMAHMGDQTSLTNVIVSPGGWKAVLILSAHTAVFDEDSAEFEAIADSLRPMK